MTAMMIRNRALIETDVEFDQHTLDHLTTALREQDTLGTPPPRLELTDWGALLIVNATLTEAEVERAKEWFIKEAIRASERHR